MLHVFSESLFMLILGFLGSEEPQHSEEWWGGQEEPRLLATPSNPGRRAEQGKAWVSECGWFSGLLQTATHPCGLGLACYAAQSGSRGLSSEQEHM